MAHNEQEVISGHMSVGLDWNYSQDGYNAYIAPTVWRWDSLDTNDGQVFDEWITEPSGTWQGYYDYSWGSGSGWRQVDSFQRRTYVRRQSAYTVSLRVQWYDATGTYYDGAFHRAGFGYRDWSVTIPALESHTVSFDANGGEGAPSSQTKWYGSILTLSSIEPTRANHEFMGWAASSAATSADYAAGGLYYADADANLYAVWKLVSNPPTVSLEVNRCTSDYVADAEGTYAMAVVAWSVDAGTVSSNVGKTVAVSWSPSTGASSKSASISGTSGTTTLKLGSGFDASSAYSLTATVTDSLGLSSTTVAKRIAPIFHTLDIGNEGKSMGLGAVASDSSSELKIGFDSLALATADVSGTVKDAIVARGASGGWEYVKYASGRCICWGKFDHTDIAWSGLAHCGVSYPFPIYDPVLAASFGSSGNPEAFLKYTASTEISTDVYGAIDGTAGGWFNLIVAGRWK